MIGRRERDATLGGTSGREALAGLRGLVRITILQIKLVQTFLFGVFSGCVV